MKRYAFIQNGTVLSIIEGKDDTSRDWAEYYGQKRGLECVVVPENESVSIGLRYENGAFISNQLSEGERLNQWRSTASLSRRRFKIGEALYQVNGTPLVQLIEALLSGLTEPTKTVATIAYNESGSFDRLDPFVLQFSGALGMSDEETDDFFKYCLDEEWNQ